MGHIGCLFEGTDASLVTNYATHEVWVGGKQVDDFPRPAPTIPDSPGHLREFLDAIKARNLDTTCNVRYGHRVTKPGLLSNIAFRTGRRLQWDDTKERIVGDSDATRYLRRSFRKILQAVTEQAPPGVERVVRLRWSVSFPVKFSPAFAA